MIKVYGPYRRKDGRAHVVHYNTIAGTRRTQSYPRYLMEQHLGRKLEKWEQVDHINDDPTDDRVENYQLLTQTENSSKSAKPTKMKYFECPVCEHGFMMSVAIYEYNQIKLGKAGPYCSKKCAGKVHH